MVEQSRMETFYLSQVSGDGCDSGHEVAPVVHQLVAQWVNILVGGVDEVGEVFGAHAHQTSSLVDKRPLII